MAAAAQANNCPGAWERSAAEIKLRAEQRAEEMLRPKKLRGGDRKSKSRDVTLKLSNLGVTKMQSHRWQSIAALPKKDFEG